jgi:UDP-glucose 4-epimerase
LALENEVPNGAYNIGTGIQTSVNELYERLRRLSAKDLPPRHRTPKPPESRQGVPSILPKLLGC